MHAYFLYMSVILTAIIAVPFYRVLKGPTVFDRLLGAGAIGTKTLVLVCLVGFVFGRIEMFVDIALAYSILNFIGILAIAKFFETPRARE